MNGGAESCPDLQRILNDPVVIEGQRQIVPMFDEFRSRSIVARSRRRLMHENKVSRADAMVPGVAVGIRVNANELRIARVDAGFFLQFP